MSNKYKYGDISSDWFADDKSEREHAIEKGLYDLANYPGTFTTVRDLSDAMIEDYCQEISEIDTFGRPLTERLLEGKYAEIYNGHFYVNRAMVALTRANLGLETGLSEKQLDTLAAQWLEAGPEVANAYLTEEYLKQNLQNLLSELSTYQLTNALMSRSDIYFDIWTAEDFINQTNQDLTQEQIEYIAKELNDSERLRENMGDTITSTVQRIVKEADFIELDTTVTYPTRSAQTFPMDKSSNKQTSPSLDAKEQQLTSIQEALSSEPASPIQAQNKEKQL